MAFSGWFSSANNGGLGLAFPEITHQNLPKLREISDYLWQQGVDDFCPTIVTTSLENIWRSLNSSNCSRLKVRILISKLAIASAQWQDLTFLQRFALIKLSRPSPENHNFVPAMQEFGLLP